MGKKTAEMITISRLFVAYGCQGIAPKNAIRVIATSLNRTLKYVESVVQNDSQSGYTHQTRPAMLPVMSAGVMMANFN